MTEKNSASGMPRAADTAVEAGKASKVDCFHRRLGAVGLFVLCCTCSFEDLVVVFEAPPGASADKRANWVVGQAGSLP